jgi:exopolyphosphatase/guanosine-5'-triphosphate,3'-diphosphate pyrophosphatase
MDQNDFMKEDRMEKGLETLQMFKDLCIATKTKRIIAVATAAVRNATNGQAFIKRIKDSLDLDVKTLTGEEEAFYDYCGVVNSIDASEGLIIDIGGGSIEMVWMDNRKIKHSHSFNFGAVTLASMFNLTDEVKESSIKALKEYLIKAFKSIDWLEEKNFNLLIGVGGTLRNIAKIDKRQKDYSFDRIHNYEMTVKSVENVFDQVKDLSLKERKNVSGLSKKRADIFIGANGFVLYLMEYLGINQLTLSGKGIREGLLYNDKILDGHIVEDVLEYSLMAQVDKLPKFKNHTLNVYALLNQLVTALEPLFSFKYSKFDGSIDKVVKTAGLLHDLGSIINYYDHHEHTFYMILNSDVNGVNHREQLLAAYIAASHRHVSYSLHKYNLNRRQFTDIIDRKGDDKELIRKVGILLEIAEGLDRNMSGAIKIHEIDIDEAAVKIFIKSSKNPNLEISDALEAAKGFEKKFNRQLNIIQMTD